MQAAAYGRLGQDPRQIVTSTGKSMTVATIAVDVARDDPDAAPLWLGIVAFGRLAEELAKHNRGELVSVAGRVQRRDYTDKLGERQQQLQIVCDSLLSARTVRPAGGRRRGAEAAA